MAPGQERLPEEPIDKHDHCHKRDQSESEGAQVTLVSCRCQVGAESR